MCIFTLCTSIICECYFANQLHENKWNIECIGYLKSNGSVETSILNYCLLNVLSSTSYDPFRKKKAPPITCRFWWWEPERSRNSNPSVRPIRSKRQKAMHSQYLSVLMEPVKRNRLLSPITCSLQFCSRGVHVHVSISSKTISSPFL